MPPEPLPWDRKEVFRDRKHNNGYDRVSEPIGGSVTRWRDSPSHGFRNDFGRWGFPSPSDFRRPPGHGKQGGWHLYPEDLSPGPGYATARPGDRFFQDGGGFRPSGPYRDGRYSRNFRESRVSFYQKDWRGHSMDYNHHHGTPPSGPGRLNDGKDQKSGDVAPAKLSVPQMDVANISDQHHSKEFAESCDVNESSMSHRVEKENSLASMGWKPIKWSRSGSLTSRGSGFCLSSSSKSAGESSDVKIELPSKIATPEESSSADAVGCIASPTSLEDTTSRKKPRLGWGEGLAKYEKKKVEGPEDSQIKSSSALCTSNSELVHSPSLTLADKSPRTGVFFECRSPMTPSSAAYSSSPGLDDKSYMKATEIDSGSNYMSPSPAPRSEIHFEGVSPNLENVDLTSPLDLNGLLSVLLQNEDQRLVDAGLIKCSALNKLLLLKGEILKVLELTESEIDSLDSELKSLKSQPGSNSPCPESSSSMSRNCEEKPCGELNIIQRPPPLTVPSSGDVIVGDMAPCGNIEEVRAEVKGEYIDSPGTATSKFTEPPSSDRPLSPNQQKHGLPGDMIIVESATYESCNLVEVQKVAGSSASNSESKVAIDGNTLGDDNVVTCGNLEDNTLDYILASNKQAATKASKLFDSLLPCSDSHIESVEATTCSRNNLLIKEKFLKRKQSMRFKERVISLKYKAFQQLWKEDLRLLSERKHRSKSQKKVESGLRSSHSGFQKYFPCIRSQFASPACNLNSFSTSELVSFTSTLLSDPQIKCYRNDLRMPALFLDKKEKITSRFLSNNGLVQDPCAVERERALINPWTAEEKDIFLDKLAMLGKDFRKIASFLDHKTTADCIEFYYKNHKSDCFKKTKKQQEFKKQEKTAPTMRYLMTSGKKWSKEMNAASLDMLGAASAIVAHDDKDVECAKLFTNNGIDRKLRGNDGLRERSSTYDIEDERETEAADVLAGICGSLSSEAMSSCITSSVDPGEGNQDWKSWKTSSEPSGIRCPPTAEVMQEVDDDTCSDESCGYVEPVDWTDEEKSSFLQAFSSYGKDFVMIARCVRTKSRDQCKVFFSKARKCLGLEMLYTDTGNEGVRAADDLDGQSDSEDACVVENDLAKCSDKSSGRTDENMLKPASNINHDHNPMTLHDRVNVSDERIPEQLDENNLNGRSQNLPPQDVSEVVPDDGSVLNEEVEKPVRSHDQENGDSFVVPDHGEEPISGHDSPITEAVVVDEGAAVNSGTVLPDKAVQFVAEIASEKSKLETTSGDHGNQDVFLPPSSYKFGRDVQVKRSSSTNDLHQLLPGQKSPDLGGSCPMSKASLNLLMQTETRMVANHMQPSTRPYSAKTETTVQPLQVYLKKCHRSASVHSVGEFPLLSKAQSQMSESGSHHRQPSPDASEKPCRNGDVKLFGQILSKSSTTEKPASDIQGSSSRGCEGRSIRGPSPCSSLDMLSVNNEMDKYAHNNGSLGLENFPVRSYGFWDGNRVQTGYPCLTDSALLLAKYPAVFANSKLEEQQPVQSIASANKSSLPSVASSSNGGLVEYQQVYPTEPYRSEMKQEDMFPEVPRQGFEAVSGLQQIELNIVQGDVGAGSSCNGLTDPVAALKLHYAKAQQHGVKLAGGREEESWRGQNGNVGR